MSRSYLVAVLLVVVAVLAYLEVGYGR